MVSSLSAAAAESLAPIALSAFDAFDICVFVLGPQQELIPASPRSYQLLRRFFEDIDGLMLPRQPSEHPAFKTLVMKRSGTMVVTGSEGERMVVRFVGSRQGQPLLLGVAITGDAPGREVPSQILEKVFGLGRNEARLAALVANGVILTEAAERLGIAASTARFVLKQVFRKVGVGRQIELVKRVGPLLVVTR